jgi:predicted amidohydrolase
MQPFRIALCQVRAHDIEDAEANLENILRALDEAGAAGAQLVGLPEVSYPAYYLRDAKPYQRAGVRPFEEVRALFAERAKRHGYWLAAGIAAPHASGGVTNSAVVLDPSGEFRGQYDKSFLWHFDNIWFERGTSFPVWETGFCKFGVLICADGRQPEIARSLAVNGAELILDLTAWVSSGRVMADLTTTQCEYLMPARAFENSVWVGAADRWGPEAGSIVYAGRSTVIDPLGVTRVCAPSDCETVIVYDIEPMQVAAIPRRPALYSRLTTPTNELPVTAVLKEPLVPSGANSRVAVVPSNGAFDAGQIAGRFRELRAQDADLVVFGGEDGPEGWQVALPELEVVVRQLGGALVLGVATTGCSAHQSTVLITPERTVEHEATHGRGIQLGEAPSPVVTTPVGNVGLLCGAEGYVPEVARSLMLEGADVLAWPLFAEDPISERVIRTRSDENRVYTAAAWPDGAMIVSPAGAPIAIAPRGTGLAMAAQVNRALSRWKDMAPGTNVVTDRVPEAYAPLVR